MHCPADLDPDRQAVTQLADKAARTCGIIKELLALRDDDRAKAEYSALITDVEAVGLAMHELMSNRALFARADAIEARAGLGKLQEALGA